MKIQIVFMGRGYDRSAELPRELLVPASASLDDALAQLSEKFSHPLPPTCLIAVCGEHLGTIASHAERSLRDGDELMLISPVAGG